MDDKQTLFPGVQPVTDQDRLKVQADAPLRPSKAQRACDVGLFGDAHKQVDLVDILRSKSNA